MKDNRTGIRSTLVLGLLIFLALALTACGGGSDDEPNENTGGGGATGGGNQSGSSNNLIINILDNIITKLAVDGVFVTLYESDNKTILQTIETGTDGVADFGDMSNSVSMDGDNKVTVTIAYKDTSSNDSEILTYFDVSPGNYTVHVKDQSCQSQGKINTEFSNIPVEAQLATLIPTPSETDDIFSVSSLGAGSSSVQISNGVAAFSDLNVCSSNLQTDGKLSQLLTTIDSTGEFVSYGFELDQTFTDGASFNGNADLTPTDLSWTSTDPNDLVNNVNIMAIRKGVVFPSLGRWLAPSDTSATSGSFPFISEFPADFYVLQAMQRISEQSTRMSMEKTNAIGENISVAFSENEFTEFGFDAQTETFTWVLTGNSNKDFILLDLEFDDIKNVYWELNIEPNVTSLTLPDLPNEVQSWFDRTDIIVDEVSVAAIELKSIDGFDAYYAAISAGGDINSTAVDGMDFVQRDLIDDDVENSGGSAGNDGTDGTGGTGGGNDIIVGNFGSVTVTGSGTESFPGDIFNPNFSSNGGIAGIVWVDANSNTATIFPSFTETGKVTFVSIGSVDGSTTWSSTDADGDVSGVSISDNTVTFNNVVLQGLTNTVTVNGNLTF